MKRMVSNGFWSILFFVVVALSTVSCGGGGGGGGSQPGPQPGPEPTPQTSSAKTVSGSVNTLSSLVASGAKLGKAVAQKAATIPDASISIESYDNSDNKIDSIVISTGQTGSFNASVKMNNTGGYLIIGAKKDGFTDFSKRISFESPNDVNLSAEIEAVNTVVATADSVLKASGGSMSAFTFGVVRYANGTKKALAGSKLTAAKAAGGATSEMEIAIPAEELAAEGVTTLVGKLQTFDSSNPDDAMNFPGEYLDSNGDRLVSLAFDYVNITDDNGKNLGEIVKAAKASGRMKKAQANPTIITRWVPAGSCKNLLRDVACAETDATTGRCKKVTDGAKDSSGNYTLADGYTVPVYAYNPRKGDWILLGLGKLDVNNDGSVDAADAAAVGDIAPENNTDGKVDHKDYQQYCKDNGGIYLRVEVTNEDFITQYWNLDYPLIFEEPKKLCFDATFKDSEGKSLSGLYASIYDDDYNPQSFSNAYGSADSTGRLILKTVTTNTSDTSDTDNTTPTATLSYYNPFIYSSETETITLGNWNDQSKSCSRTETKTIAKPKMCNAEGKVVDEAGRPKISQSVTIYGGYPSYFYRWAYTDSTGKFTAEVRCEQDLNVYTGYDWTVKAVFNANGNASQDYEKTDENDKVVLNDIVNYNMAPYAYGYLSTYSIKITGSAAVEIYGYDYDGNYPLSYTVSAPNMTDKTGTIYSYDGWKEVILSGLAEGSYPLTLTVTDSASKSSTYELGTLTVTAGNRPPVISYAFPNTNDVTAAGQTVNLYGWAYDLDADILGYLWTVNGGTAGISNPTATAPTFTVPDNTAKTYSVTLTVTDNGDPQKSDTRNFNIEYKCAYSLSSTGSVALSGSGSTGSLDVTTNAPNCSWSATSNASWITNVTPVNGTGNGTVSYNVQPNTTTSSRTGTITVGGMVYTVNQAGATCSYSISPTQNLAVTSSGGSGSVSVTSITGCAWNAISNVTWVTITSGSSGSGNGAVNYSVASNPTASSRTGTLTIGGQTFTVTQSGVACSYSITPTNYSHTSAAGSGSINVTSLTGCPWNAATTDSWITITSGASGSGNGTVTYSVSANSATTSRTGTITVGGKTFTVYQQEAPCTYNVSAATSTSYTYTGGSGTINVTSSGSTCTWGATSDSSWLTVSSGSTGSGNGTVSYAVAANNTSSASRTGKITIAGNAITITQAGAPCSYSISPVSNNFTSSGGTGSISMNSLTGCSWTATTADSWITVTTASGSGSGTISYSVSANAGSLSRTGTITAGGQTFTVTQSGASCSYSISQTSASVSATGGTGSVNVIATSDCVWSATSNDSWITVTSGASGNSNGTVGYSIAANTTAISRTGTITIAGQTFTVTQSGVACSYTISSTSNSFASSGGTGTVSVTSPTGCTWTATSNVSWISVTVGASGSGNGSVTYSVSTNTGTADRTGTLTIAGQTYTVTQGWSGTSIIIN